MTLEDIYIADIVRGEGTHFNKPPVTISTGRGFNSVCNLLAVTPDNSNFSWLTVEHFKPEQFVYL